MLELFHHQSRSSTLPSWPGSTTKLNTLPPLYSSSAAGFAAPYAPPTPPEMNGMSVHGGLHPRGPVARPGGSSDASFSKYAHASQPRPRQQSSYSPASSSATSAIYNSRPLTEQADRKDYSAPAESPISPDLRIPPKVDTPQHSMPQLAAEVTCLFWFENGANLKNIAESAAPPASPIPFIPDAKPTAGFRKWVATLLSTTQVKQNVVMLALLFIYRLKKANPTVKGKPGSEYRLLTVALMLGNKFLDDNTYTNKTWADVSGISAHEVHIMEVEFLSNMRYSLFVSDAEWASWHITLGRFGTYIFRAIQSWEAVSRPAPLLSAAFQIPAALPSPPSSGVASPHVFGTLSPNHVTRNSMPAVPSPIRALPEIDFRSAARKRSFDEAAHEPPAKRHAPNFHSRPHTPLAVPAPAAYMASPWSLSQIQAHAAGLPPPMVSNAAPAVGTPQTNLPQLPLPPRAMSMVFPGASAWNQATSAPISIPALQTTGLPPPSGPQSRQLSPYPNSAGSSPTSATFPNVGTPIGLGRLSPSYYLAQRSSPYKPVRRPQTLLAPPPPVALNNPARRVSLEQMQYHSLGRPMTERQHGHLPYNAWPHGQHWAELPPPVPTNRM